MYTTFLLQNIFCSLSITNYILSFFFLFFFFFFIGPYIFICVRREEKEPAITDIAIFEWKHDQTRPSMDGWKVIENNLNQGGNTKANKVYLGKKKKENDKNKKKNKRKITN